MYEGFLTDVGSLFKKKDLGFMELKMVAQSEHDYMERVFKY